MIRKLVPALLFIGATCLAGAAPASEASIRELLTVTEAHKLVDGMIPQVEGMMKASMDQAMAAQGASADDQKLATAMRTKMMKIIKEELSWDALEPMYISIYQQSFTQEELDGILAFYKTPAGVAMTKKMPVVLQKTMGAMQQKIGPMAEKIQAAIQETIQESEAGKAKSDTPQT